VVRRLAQRLAVRAAVSEAARTTAVHALGGRYEVGFNGIEVDRYRAVDPWPKERPAILFLGRHEERKGLGVLLEAFAQMDASPGHRRPVLWIAGDGPKTASLQARYPESTDVTWLGIISEEEKVRRLTAADVLCAPSFGGESFGIVLLEGMAARTPVVAGDIEGYRAAAGACAVLVPPRDARALGEALRGVLEGELAVATDGDIPGHTPRDRWLETAAQRAEQWSMERLAAWYLERYRSAMVSPLG
jgi:phosphatidylinositol alpha-mannosyltransferase